MRTVAGMVWEQSPHDSSQDVGDVLQNPDQTLENPHEKRSCDVIVINPHVLRTLHEHANSLSKHTICIGHGQKFKHMSGTVMVFYQHHQSWL